MVGSGRPPRAPAARPRVPPRPRRRRPPGPRRPRRQPRPRSAATAATSSAATAATSRRRRPPQSTSTAATSAEPRTTASSAGASVNGLAASAARRPPRTASTAASSAAGSLTPGPASAATATTSSTASPASSIVPFTISVAGSSATSRRNGLSARLGRRHLCRRPPERSRPVLPRSTSWSPVRHMPLCTKGQAETKRRLAGRREARMLPHATDRRRDRAWVRVAGPWRPVRAPPRDLRGPGPTRIMDGSLMPFSPMIAATVVSNRARWRRACRPSSRGRSAPRPTRRRGAAEGSAVVTGSAPGSASESGARSAGRATAPPRSERGVAATTEVSPGPGLATRRALRAAGRLAASPVPTSRAPTKAAMAASARNPMTACTSRDAASERADGAGATARRSRAARPGPAADRAARRAPSRTARQRPASEARRYRASSYRGHASVLARRGRAAAASRGVTEWADRRPGTGAPAAPPRRASRAPGHPAGTGRSCRVEPRRLPAGGGRPGCSAPAADRRPHRAARPRRDAAAATRPSRQVSGGPRSRGRHRYHQPRRAASVTAIRASAGHRRGDHPRARA